MASVIRIIIVSFGLAAVIDPSAAIAQESSENTGISRRTLELGVMTSVGPVLRAVGFGFRIAVASDGPVAFEAEAEWMDAGRRSHLPDQVVWHYLFQGVHELRAGGQGRAKVFATYGASGWSVRNATLTGLHNSFIPPFMPTGGVGAQWPLGSHAALRTDFQVVLFFAEGVTMTPRVTAGVTLPIRVTRRSAG